MSVWRIKAIVWLLAAVLLVYPLAAQAQPATKALTKAPVAATTTRHPSITRLDPTPVQSRIPSRITITAARAANVSTFVIKPVDAGTVLYGTYTCEAWPTDPQVLAAFQYSADLWASRVASSVPITIDACWTTLGTNELAATSPNDFWSEVNGAPSPDIVYPSALANALEGSDLNGAVSDMTILLNSTPSPYSWFFDTSGPSPSPSQIDFATTTFHEIAHGLGFYDSTYVDAGVGSWGYVTDNGSGQVTLPGAYDMFIKNHAGDLMTNGTLFPNPSTALGTFLTSNGVYFDSPSVLQAQLYAPSTYVLFTSIGHLDIKYDGTADALMTPFIHPGQLTHDPGLIALGVLKDIGWSVSMPAPNQVTLLPQPVRLVDTRAGSGFLGAGQALQGYTSYRRFTLVGEGGIPANATAVLVNLTAAGYPANGWLSAYPACTTRPATSNVNFDTRENAIANFAIVKLGVASAGAGCQGAIDVTGAAGTNIIVDVTGYLVSTSNDQIVLLSSPERIVDTRPGSGSEGSGQPPQNTSTPKSYHVGGQVDIPAGAVGVISNLTTVDYTRNGWVAAYPTGGTAPLTSSVNFDIHEYAIANTAVVKLGTSGQVNLVASAPTDAIIDVSAYLVR